MRSLLILLPVTALLACGGSDSTSPVTPPPVVTPGAPTPTVTTAVDMLSNTFTPAAIRVAPSATVTFTNSDNRNHNVTFANNAAAATGNYSTGSKAVVMPATAGTYAYSCTIHSGMVGTVQVQ
ncbi:MAG: plastocyanin/azurin family copper-binding protein [Gemmatimonadaceae bacterium]